MTVGKALRRYQITSEQVVKFEKLLEDVESSKPDIPEELHQAMISSIRSLLDDLTIQKTDLERYLKLLKFFV